MFISHCHRTKSVSTLFCYLSILKSTSYHHTHIKCLPTLIRRTINTLTDTPSADTSTFPVKFRRWKSRRCDGFKVSDGSRCKKIVRIEKTIPDVQSVYCHCHIPVKNDNDNNLSNNNPREISLINKIKSLTQYEESLQLQPPEKLYDCWTCNISHPRSFLLY